MSCWGDHDRLGADDDAPLPIEFEGDPAECAFRETDKAALRAAFPPLRLEPVEARSPWGPVLGGLFIIAVTGGAVWLGWGLFA